MPRVLIVDLNNFATFPTLAIGLLVASLRNEGFDVEVLCPLSHDVPATTRERCETRVDHWMRRLHLTTNPWLLKLRDCGRATRLWWLHKPHPRVIAECSRALSKNPDIVLLSAYLNHHPSVVAICAAAKHRGIPVLLGGAMFNLEETAQSWRDIPGLTAIFGGEADLAIADLIRCTLGDGNLLDFKGVTLPSGETTGAAPPLAELDRLPVPDFRDFPWERYRVRVVPVMTGRGCGWGHCLFCSDVASASGRTFRSRPITAVLDEIEEQARCHDSKHFLFLDLKLNSDLDVWRGLIDGIQAHVPGAEWLGTVHVDNRKDNGLSKADLCRAFESGMRRISFGFETGSQGLLNAMRKGAHVEQYAQFVNDAHEAGLSVRCTAFHGFPGETAEDLERTHDFLATHGKCIDRIRFNTFSIMAGTPMMADLKSSSPRFHQIDNVLANHAKAQASYRHRALASPAYRRAKRKLLAVVHEINRKPLRAGTEALDGLM
jgi:radical SAM superfamily enzyme YgiQ (UPF0313 family)